MFESERFANLVRKKFVLHMWSRHILQYRLAHYRGAIQYGLLLAEQTITLLVLPQDKSDEDTQGEQKTAEFV